MNTLEMIEIRRRFHQIPEMGFKEYETQKLILEYIEQWRTPNMKIEQWETGVVVFIKGEADGREYGFRCDIDGLPLTEETGLEYKSKHIGMMHACGHDFHITFGLSLIHYFSQNKPKNNYWVVFQPAEEGPGGAKSMIDYYKEKWKNVEHFFALHMDPTLQTGAVGYNYDKMFAGAQEIDITLRSSGGHAAFPEGVFDLNHLISKFYIDIKEMEYELNESSMDEKEIIIHFGKIDSGQVRNSFPTISKMYGTIRSFEHSKTKIIIKRLGNWLETEGVDFELHEGPYYKPVINKKDLVIEFTEAIKGLTNIEKILPRHTGEDFGFFSEEYPSFMFWLGSKSDYGLHENKLNLDEDALEVGKDVLIKYIETLESRK